MCHFDLPVLKGRLKLSQRPYVLIVDDQLVNRCVLGAMVAKLGFDVCEACDGLEAVQKLRKGGREVCLVLLDLQMPVMDGWSTARILRQEHGLSLPILACTASDLLSPAGTLISPAEESSIVLPSVQQHALDCGADMCLSKPLGVSQLTAALQELRVLPHQLPGHHAPFAASAHNAAAITPAHGLQQLPRCPAGSHAVAAAPAGAPGVAQGCTAAGAASICQHTLQ